MEQVLEFGRVLPAADPLTTTARGAALAATIRAVAAGDQDAFAALHDYLFDRTGEPDPDVQRLEQILGRLRTTAPAPTLPTNVEPRTTDDERRYVGFRFVAPALAAAAAVVLMVGLTWQHQLNASVRKHFGTTGELR